jgi:formate/nitrite transporter FocA (FNT family)
MKNDSATFVLNSVANMFFLPLTWLYGMAGVDAISIMANLIPVTLGNIAGGGGVALTYWLISTKAAGNVIRSTVHFRRNE